MRNRVIHSFLTILMRLQLASVLLVLLEILPACERSTRIETPQRQLDTESATSAEQPFSASHVANQELGAATKHANQDCVRGVPVPILLSTGGGEKPTLEKLGEYEARETVSLAGGIELTVRQFGCAHYVVEYAFVIKGEKTTARNPEGWLRRAAELLASLRVTPAQRQAVQSIADTLQKSAGERYAYGHRLRMSEIETLSATVDSVMQGVRLVVLYDLAL